MTLTERIAKAEAERHLPTNVVPFRRDERRTVSRWIEWSREHQNERNVGQDLTGYIRGDAA